MTERTPIEVERDELLQERARLRAALEQANVEIQQYLQQHGEFKPHRLSDVVLPIIRAALEQTETHS
jgi:hypothetical protein